MPSLARTAGSGFFFGAALTASRVYVPSVILSQMRMQDYHMLVAFLCASASSALIMVVLERLNIAKRNPPKNSSMGCFGPYDANVVGGLMIGFGMATTGACPGTVIVQVATGIRSGVYVAIGGILGGILYAKYGHLLKQAPESSPSTAIASDQYTIPGKLHLKEEHVLLSYEVVCLLLISTATTFGVDRRSPWLHPAIGGGLIGAAQAASLLMTGNAIGVSRAYEEAGQLFWYLLSSKQTAKALPPMSAMTFAAGILAGSFVMSRYLPVPSQRHEISSILAIVGGCVMIVGARLAGGCTSGHGISGLAMFSIASMISVVSMFGGGIATGLLQG